MTLKAIQPAIGSRYYTSKKVFPIADFKVKSLALVVCFSHYYPLLGESNVSILNKSG